MNSINVTSEDLRGGKWDDSISNTSVGDNASPELSWERVKDAEEYVVYMIDEYDTDYWLHWRARGIREPGFAHGRIPEDVQNEYIGPYPPEGIHDYVIYVFALKGPAFAYPGHFDAESVPVEAVREALDKDADGKDGNILAEGSISGTYAAG